MAMELRLVKAFAFSLVFHLVVLAVLGLAGKFHPIEREETIYDVALMGGSPPAPAPIAAPPQPKETIPEPREEVRPPEPDDIVEKVVKEKPHPVVQPSSTVSSDSNAPAGTGASGTGTSSGTGDGDADGIQAPAVAPRIIKSMQPPYPSSARSKGIEGVVGLVILLDRKGVPENVEVIASSGNDALDDAARSTVYKWRFSAGLNSYGRPVRCYVRIPVAFKLK